MLNIILFVLFLVLGLSDFTLTFVWAILKTKNKASDTLAKKDILILLISLFTTGLFTIGSNLFLGYMQGWEYQLNELLCLIFGSYLFATSISAFINLFVLYYYKPTLVNPLHRYLFYAMIVSFVSAIITLFLMSEGFANHLTYPLVNGIEIGSLHIAFYGILIVGGAVVTYFICDHRFYQRFHRHGILDPIFLIAFPFGIIGARLWYCLVLEPDKFLADPLRILYIWEGGLAIQGGVLFGAAFGVGAMLLFRRYVNIRWAMDIIIPAILIAQAIGRWGNFFNHEVYGAAVSATDWSFLPTIVLNQMSTSFVNGMPNGETIFVPLFLIESITNIAGYFIIAYVVGEGLKKWLSLGDLTGAYLIWYGLTRIVMEPLRYAQFEYGESYITAFVFLGAGILLIIGVHIYDFVRRKKNLPPKNWYTV